MSLKGQKLLIIGGSSGIGKATAVTAVDAGAHVIIGGRSKEHLARAQDDIGGRVDTCVMDVRDSRELEFTYEKLEGFDHLVVTAAEDYEADFVECDIEEAKKIFDTKFWGQFTAAQLCVPFISEWGSIILFSGVPGYRVVEGACVAGAANAAVESLVRSLAVELSPLRVNAVAPGDLSREHANESLPVRRPGDVGHAAEAVLFLIENQYISGTVLRVDGGRTAV